MDARNDKALVESPAGGGGGSGGGVSLGKGAWDCDNNCAIPPEKEVRYSLRDVAVQGVAV